MVAGARTPITAPPATAPRFGLLASIPPTKDQARWELGIKYVPEYCDLGSSYGDICNRPTFNALDFPGIVEWDAYVLSYTERCSAFSGYEDNAARVERGLNADRERQLGAEFWDGTMAQADGLVNSWLADNSDPAFTDLTGSSAAGYVEALSCLQQYLAEQGGEQGVIHATSQVVTFWESFRLLRREGNRILTMEDHIVVPSPGYSGSGPSGGVWAYATSIPRIFLGEVQMIEDKVLVTDRTTNDVFFTAWQFGLVEWDRCHHGAIEIDVEPCGPAS